MDAFFQLLRTLGPGRLLIVLSTVGGIIFFFFHLMSGASTGDMGTLYAGVDPSEGGRIIAHLDTMGVPVRVEDNGTQIMVPKNEVGRLRMVLAEAGLPSGGLIGYEIFDRNDGLGATSFTQDMNHLRALEGELARSIRTLAHVAAARVHLVLPRRELFSRQFQDPSASVVLRMNGPARLGNQQVEAIRHLVAAAVPGLDPRRVAVIDNKGLLLAKGHEGGDEKPSPNTTEDLRLAYEERLSRSIEQLLEKSVGIGKVRTQVTVDMDFDHLTENAEIYDPDGQVIRSTQTAQEGNTSSETNQQAVTVENNLPKSGDAGGAGARSQANRAEETVNYEISKTIKTHIKEIGNVKRLSVAILVDGSYTTDPTTKEKKYKPRSQDEINQYIKLIQSAIGYNKERGDTVEVVSMAFAEDEIVGSDDKILGFDRGQLIRLIEFIFMIIAGMVVIMLVIRPLVLQLIEIGKQRLAMAQETAQQQAAAAPSITEQPVPTEPVNTELEKKFNLGRIEGLVRTSSLTKISDIIEKFPQQTVSMIRMWLAEGTEGQNKDF